MARQGKKLLINVRSINKWLNQSKKIASVNSILNLCTFELPEIIVNELFFVEAETRGWSGFLKNRIHAKKAAIGEPRVFKYLGKIKWKPVSLLEIWCSLKKICTAVKIIFLLYITWQWWFLSLIRTNLSIRFYEKGKINWKILLQTIKFLSSAFYADRFIIHCI